jgi:putative spermidine/putrescine transport system permease protein
LFLTVPVALTILTAFTANAFRGLSSGLTLEWIGKVLSVYGETIFRSFYLALTTLGICVVCGVPLAYGFVKFTSSRVSALLEESLVLPLSIPGIAIGLGILLFWGTVNWFRHSWLFILAGHVIFCLPFMVRSVTAVLRVAPLDVQEEAARTMGASFLARFLGLVVPSAATGVIAGALQVLTLSIGEFNISWMLQTPFTRTLPVGLADSYASMRLEIGAAYTVVFFALIVPLLVFTQKIPALVNRLKHSRNGNQARIEGKADEPDKLSVSRGTWPEVEPIGQLRRGALADAGNAGDPGSATGHNPGQGLEKLWRPPGPAAH